MSKVSPQTQRLLYRLSVALIVLAAFWLRVGDLISLPPGLSSDESMNANDAFHILKAGGWRFPFYENYGEPEPLYRFILSGIIPLLGPRIWAFRLVAALIGTVTVATLVWTVRQVFSEQPALAVRFAGVLAAAALAVAVGHITLTRGLYRAVPLPLFILLWAGFLWRGLRRNSLADFAVSGVALALCYYTYTAGFILPLTFIPLSLSWLLFRRQRWRQYGLGLIVMGAVALLLLLPVGYLLSQEPQRVLGRAAEVTETDVSTSTNAFNSIADKVLGLGQRTITVMPLVWFVSGDSNVQYNTDRAPVVPVAVAAFFVVGMGVSLFALRQPRSVFLLTLMFITSAPAIFSSEPGHGLRITGAFAAFPLLVAAGASALSQWPLAPGLRRAGGILIIGLIVGGVAWARYSYASFWGRPSSIFILGRDLTYGEWFFRPDNRDLANWIGEQSRPTLVPLEPLLDQTTHAWLLNHYPNVQSADPAFAIPAEVQVAFAWRLEIGDFITQSREYALFQNGTITLLPPLTEATQNDLIAQLGAAQTVYRPNGNPLAKLLTPGPGFKFDLEPRQVSASVAEPIVTLANGLALTGWWGPGSLRPGQQQTVTYTLDWTTTRPQSDDLYSFVGLLTIGNEKVAGVDAEMTRWLHPAWTWEPAQSAPVTYSFTVPPDLASGAYRLALIMDQQLTTIGWVKVPQTSEPAPDASRVRPGATFDDSFLLYGVSARDEGGGNLRLSLYWQSLVERPLTDAIIFVHLQTAQGDLIAQADGQPWQGQYPTFIWSKAERVQTDFVLNVGATQLDTLSAWVGMYTFPSLNRLQVTQAGQPVLDNRLLLGPVSDLQR